jgi:hypothetical protein
MNARITVNIAAFCRIVGTVNKSIASFAFGEKYTRESQSRTVISVRCDRSSFDLAILVALGSRLRQLGNELDLKKPRP